MRLQLEEVLVHVAEDADGRSARRHQRVNLRRKKEEISGSAQLVLSEGGIQSQSTPQNGPSSGQPRLGPRVSPSISVYLHLSPSISVYLQPRPIGGWATDAKRTLSVR